MWNLIRAQPLLLLTCILTIVHIIKKRNKVKEPSRWKLVNSGSIGIKSNHCSCTKKINKKTFRWSFFSLLHNILKFSAHLLKSMTYTSHSTYLIEQHNTNYSLANIQGVYQKSSSWNSQYLSLTQRYYIFTSYIAKMENHMIPLSEQSQGIHIPKCYMMTLLPNLWRQNLRRLILII